MLVMPMPISLSDWSLSLLLIDMGVIIIIISIIIIIIKKCWHCKAERVIYVHSISPKTPALQYQPIDRKKIKGKRVEDYSRDRVV